MTSPVPASSSVSREFLVQRLVADARNRQSVDPDADDPSSDSSSETGTLPDPTMNFGNFNSLAASFAHANPFHYAATLASIAQMNYIQPTANTIPFLYPHLYQSLLTFPDLDQLRLALRSPGGVSGQGGVGLKSPPTRSPVVEPRTPDTVKSTASTHSPSPRKRPSNTHPKPAKPTSIKDLNSPNKKARAMKRLTFDNEETASPVSGMFIKEATEVTESVTELQEAADSEDTPQVFQVTEEARIELAKIPNIIGDYICALCKVKYEDAFKLGQHRCPRIIHEEYRCPECDKVFSCPANLASHRRWHKPKSGELKTAVEKQQPTMDKEEPLNLSKSNPEEKAPSVLDQSQEVRACFECEVCGKKFETHRWLRNHSLQHSEFGATLSDEDPETKCAESDCGLWFPSKSSAEKHQRAAHRNFGCKFCDEGFSSSPALTRHINKHHPSSDCRVVLLDTLQDAS